MSQVSVYLGVKRLSYVEPLDGLSSVEREEELPELLINDQIVIIRTNLTLKVHVHVLSGKLLKTAGTVQVQSLFVLV